jgi:DNA-binding winged helix-turn-helix (wHTH) protein
LRTHIAALRKALGDGEDGARYIATVPGRVMRMVGRVDDVRLLATQLAAERLVTK